MISTELSTKMSSTTPACLVSSSYTASPMCRGERAGRPGSSRARRRRTVVRRLSVAVTRRRGRLVVGVGHPVALAAGRGR